MKEQARILVIDDDVYIGDMVEEMLRWEGYAVERAYSGTEAALCLEIMRAGDREPDLILLDLMLPGLSGEEVLSGTGDIPVIVVSARAALDDKVELLLGGAADYITKPFESRELLARVAVQLRKRRGGKPDSPVYAGMSVDGGQDGISAMPAQGMEENRAVQALRFDEIVLTEASHMVTVAGTPVKLTRTEYAILKILMRNSSQVIAKSVLLDRISEEAPDCVESSLKVHISNLRGKLRAVNGKDYIEAVWGIGFKMRTG